MITYLIIKGLNAWIKKSSLLVLLVFLGGCIPYKAYIYMIPSHKDLERFKTEQVAHDTECYDFIKLLKNKSFEVTNWVYSTPLLYSPLETFLKDREAQYFLVIKNDTIVYDYQDQKIKSYKPSSSFSISKVFVSALLGKAIEEGYIPSTQALVKDYIPEFNYDENFNYLTLDHLINQKSGIRIDVDDISDTYYGKIEKILDEIHFTATPGTHFEYVNINTILLSICIERVTKKDLHVYFSEKIWSKIGTCDSAVWGYDYKTNHTRSFCCFGSSPKDYAKFARLYLNKGNWNGVQLIDSNWITSTTSYKNSSGEEMGYNNYWYIGEKEVGDYMAIGMYRQQVYINPKENVIIVCFMKFNGNNLPIRWWQLLRQIAAQA